MKRRRQRGLTAAERAEMWRRWRQGQSLCEIGRALERAPTSVNRVVLSTGGFSPPVRRRSPRSLSLSEREDISRGLCAEKTVSQIAVEVGRPPLTISREISHNGGRERYRAAAGCRRRGRDRLEGQGPVASPAVIARERGDTDQGAVAQRGVGVLLGRGVLGAESEQRQEAQRDLGLAVKWFHAPLRADRWWLYSEDSLAAGGARGLARGLIYDGAGRLVCSVAQEMLFRADGATSR